MTRPNFFNENSGRSFPFTKESLDTLVSPTTLDKIPDSAIVDFGAIMGVTSAYVEGSDEVTLDRVTRSGGKFYFYFKTTALGAIAYWLVFTRDVGETDYLTEYVDAVAVTAVVEESVSISVSEQSVSVSTTACGVSPAWSGYLTTGDLSDLADFIADGNSVYLGDPVIEPALIKNQSDSFIRSINIANADRTRADTPDECRDLIWKVEPEDVYVREVCLTGRLRFEEGYNADIEQSTTETSIRVGASVGAGAGEACTQVPVFTDELPPFGGDNLDGAFSCSDVIRSINGIGGRIVQLLAGPGVSITPDPGNNRIGIAIDLNSLKACIDLPESVEESECSFSDVAVESCGPI